MKPDPNSNSKEREGKRVVDSDCERGYYLVNYTKYRDTRDEESRREYMKSYMRKYRGGNNNGEPVNTRKQPLATLALLAEAEAEVKEEEDLLSGKPDVRKGYHPASRTVLHLLNGLSLRNYRETDSNLRIISQRLNEEGVTLEGVQLMLARQVKAWKDTSQWQYFRPETLFNKTKFDSYYTTRSEPIIHHGTKSKPTQQPLISESGHRIGVQDTNWVKP
jgi:uncharacterized phage protein (TIGR02220 family)